MDAKMRLAGRNGFGEFRVLGKNFDSEHTAIQRALERLFAYEELGLTPGEIAEKLRELKAIEKTLSSILEEKTCAKPSIVKTRRLTGRDLRSGRAYYLKCFEEPCGGYGCKISNCPLTEQVCERLCELEEA